MARFSIIFTRTKLSIAPVRSRLRFYAKRTIRRSGRSENLRKCSNAIPDPGPISETPKFRGARKQNCRAMCMVARSLRQSGGLTNHRRVSGRWFQRCESLHELSGAVIAEPFPQAAQMPVQGIPPPLQGSGDVRASSTLNQG